MRLVDIVRRFSGPAAGLLAAGAVCLACSSTTSGAPASGGGGGGVSLGSLPRSPSLTVPSLTDLPSLSGIPSISGLPSIGGSEAGSAFCKDFDGGDLSSLGSSDPSQAVALWDKLTADAPDEIKSDVQAVDKYLHDAISGNITGVDAQALSTAAQHIGTYYAGHCLSS